MQVRAVAGRSQSLGLAGGARTDDVLDMHLKLGVERTLGPDEQRHGSHGETCVHQHRPCSGTLSNTRCLLPRMCMVAAHPSRNCDATQEDEPR